MERAETVRLDERTLEVNGVVRVVEITFDPPRHAVAYKVTVEGAWQTRHLDYLWQAETVRDRLLQGGQRLATLVSSAQALRQAANLLAEAGRGGQHVRGEGSRTAFEQRREEAGINIFRMMQQLEQAIELIAHNGSAEL